tara:strand:- start:912 stop:3272 length:2361 start_codon:yes stop_codon:yes gene_type:complete
MKTNKINLIICLLLAMVMGISACSDEFDESEFIKEQADLAESKAAKDHERALAVIQAQLDATLAAITAQANVDTELAQLQALLNKELEMLRESLSQKEDSLSAANYLAAYRAAGLFTEFTANIVSDDTPLEGVQVSLSSISTPVTTNAAGQAVFKDVVVGVNRMTVASDDYLDMQADLTFNRLTVRQVGTTTVALPATASITLSLLSEALDADETATINGVVTVETDLTNDAPEFPTDLTISADLTNYVNTNGVIAGIDGFNNFPNNVAFTEGELGVATVDPATGAYSMLVPVSENGTNIKLIFPEIKANQTIAIAKRNDVDIPAEIASVPAIFSLDNNAASNVESVRGFDIVINDPATPGTGLAFDYTPVPTSINNGFFNSSNLKNSTGQAAFYNNTAIWTYRLTSAGSGYTGSPALMHGTKAIGYGFLKGYVNTLTVTNAGTGYGNAQNVQLQLIANISGGGTTFLGAKNIQSTATGTLPATITVDDNDGFGKNNAFINSQEITSFEIRVIGGNNDAVVTASLTTSLYGFSIDDAPEGEFTSAPTFTFTGGGANATQATLSITAYHKQAITISNAGTGYTIKPDNILIEGDRLANTNGSFTSGVTSNVDIYTNGAFNGNSSLLGSTELDRNGGIRFINEDNDYYTSDFYETKPTTVITDTNTDKFDPRFNVDNDGGLSLDFISSNGDGYDQPRSVSVTPRLGATGSGAEFRINEFFDASSGEYSYQGFSVVKKGEGYVSNINRSTQAPNINSRYTLFSLKPGQTATRDVVYGTGVRLENVGGDN